MTCDETLWPCWMCRGTAVGVEDSAHSIGRNAELTWENRGGPEGASTPVVPALDQHTSLEGSASRG